MTSPSAREVAKELIIAFEAPNGFEPKAYDDGYGNPTIGYGHLITDQENFVIITQEQAQRILERDMQISINGAHRCLNMRCIEALDNYQMGAIYSFVFNIGVANFMKSDLRKNLNHLNFDEAVFWFRTWRSASGEISEGLILRRITEARAFRDKVVERIYEKDMNLYPELIY